jgi:hypothetical protein
MRRLMMARITWLVLALACPLPALPCAAGPIRDLKTLKLEVPIPDEMFPDGPGVDSINGNCLVCHSADHVMNQPSLTRKGWEEVVEKMIKAYKAPISGRDAAAIVDYLVRIKGKP